MQCLVKPTHYWPAIYPTVPPRMQAATHVKLVAVLPNQLQLHISGVAIVRQPEEARLILRPRLQLSCNLGHAVYHLPVHRFCISQW